VGKVRALSAQTPDSLKLRFIAVSAFLFVDGGWRDFAFEVRRRHREKP